MRYYAAKKQITCFIGGLSRCDKGRSGHFFQGTDQPVCSAGQYTKLITFYCHLSNSALLPHLVECNYPLLSFGPVHFRFKGCWVVCFICIQIIILILLKYILEANNGDPDQTLHSDKMATRFICLSI